MFTTESIRTKDGSHVFIRIYQPDGNPRNVIVISPSVQEVQEFYFDLACFFRDKQFAVITFDFRGTGDSAPEALKGFEANLQNWAQQDLDAVLRYTKNLLPGKELTLIGHGIGGEIIGLAPASQFINRIVLVSCALSCSRLRRWKDKIWIEAMKAFVKAASWLFGYFPGKGLGVFNDLPKGVMFEWIHWCNNSNGLFDDFPDQNYRKLQVPLIAFSFADDWRSQESGVKALLDHFTSACIRWHHIKPKQVGRKKVGHSGFFIIQSKKYLWQPLLQWIEDEKCDESDQFSGSLKPL